MKSEAFRFGFEIRLQGRPQSASSFLKQGGSSRILVSEHLPVMKSIDPLIDARNTVWIRTVLCFKIPVKKAFYNRAA